LKNKARHVEKRLRIAVIDSAFERWMDATEDADKSSCQDEVLSDDVVTLTKKVPIAQRKVALRVSASSDANGQVDMSPESRIKDSLPCEKCGYHPGTEEKVETPLAAWIHAERIPSAFPSPYSSPAPANWLREPSSVNSSPSSSTYGYVGLQITDVRPHRSLFPPLHPRRPTIFSLPPFLSVDSLSLSSLFRLFASCFTCMCISTHVHSCTHTHTHTHTHRVVGVSDLVDKNHVRQGMPGYSNADVQPGDLLVQIDGHHCEMVSLEEIHMLLRGERGSLVQLTFTRAGTLEQKYQILVTRHGRHEYDRPVADADVEYANEMPESLGTAGSATADELQQGESFVVL
jgi:hypothetical protein